MKNLIFKLTLLIGILTGSLLAPVLRVQAVNCDNPTTTADRIQCGACGASGEPDCSGNPSSLGDTIRTIVNVITVVAGAIAVIMIIVGGLRYITSAGNAEGAKSARNTILYAIVGLIIVAMAQIIVHFTLNTVNKQPPSRSSSSSSSGGLSGSSDSGTSSGPLKGTSIPQ